MWFILRATTAICQPLVDVGLHNEKDEDQYHMRYNIYTYVLQMFCKLFNIWLGKTSIKRHWTKQRSRKQGNFCTIYKQQSQIGISD